MRIHTDFVSRTERIASIAVATGVTVASALLVLASARPRFLPDPVPVTTRDAEQLSEHLTYFVTTPTSTVALARPAAQSRLADTSATRERVSKPDRDVRSPSGGGVPRLTTSTQPAIADTEVPWPAPAMSPLLWPDPEPIRFDSALRAVRDNLAGTLAAGQLENLSLTQSDRDAHLRAEALAAIAARGASVPITRTTSAGGRVDIPLPFSGPSSKQRERERTINAQTMKSLARVLQRLDSVVASRKRRYADSLAHVEDSLHRDTRSQN